MLILWAIDVGQGDGLLLRMPTGEHVLVDSGVNTDKNAVPDFLREKGVEEIEYAVFTHPHADHIGAAAEVVRGFRVKNVYMPDVAHTSKTYLDLLDALEADESVSVRRAVAGESFSIGEVTFDILSPIEDKYSDLNLYSAVLRVTYREKRFLLMGDAEQPNETALLASANRCGPTCSRSGITARPPRHRPISCGRSGRTARSSPAARATATDIPSRSCSTGWKRSARLSTAPTATAPSAPSATERPSRSRQNEPHSENPEKASSRSRAVAAIGAAAFFAPCAHRGDSLLSSEA